MKIRVGFGYDVHPLEMGRPFYLGGIHIPHTSGATGHSDADVLIHAICDALLGAAALRDIGFHFPNTDEQYKGIDSKILLKLTQEKLNTEHWLLGNLDCTLCLEKPKIQRNPLQWQQKHEIEKEECQGIQREIGITGHLLLPIPRWCLEVRQL